MIDQHIRAKVLKLEGDVVTLGLYLQGAWHRITALTTVVLEPGTWIEGDLVVPPDGSLVQLQVYGQNSAPPSDHGSLVPSSGNDGIDFEA